MKRPIIAVTAASVAAINLVTALAAWHDGASGSARSVAEIVKLQAKPAFTVTGRDVAVSWTQDTLSDGTHNTASSVTRTVTPASGNCVSGSPFAAGTTHCSDTGLPSGTWSYTVTPVFAGVWHGTAGSASVVIPSPSLTLSPTAVGTLAGNTTLAGTVAAFLDGDTFSNGTGAAASWWLNGATSTALTASGWTSPLPASAGGTESGSLTINAGSDVPLGTSTITYQGSGSDAGTAATFAAGTVSLVNGSGTANRPDKGDKVIVTFPQAVNPGTICNGWTGASALSSQHITVSIALQSGADVLSINDGGSNDCGSGQTIHVGTISLGTADYTATSITYSGGSSNMSSLQFDSAKKVLTITLGGPSAPAGTHTGGVSAVYTPDTAIKFADGASAVKGTLPFTQTGNVF